jgi:hypothetical protein
VRALLRDDEVAVRKILEAQRRASSGFDVVADEVVAPAMALLGERWAKGSLEIYGDDHRKARRFDHADRRPPDEARFLQKGRRWRISSSSSASTASRW